VDRGHLVEGMLTLRTVIFYISYAMILPIIK